MSICLPCIKDGVLSFGEYRFSSINRFKEDYKRILSKLFFVQYLKMAKSPTSKSSIDSLAKRSSAPGRSNFTVAVIVFIVSLLIIWFVLYAFRPVFIQEKNAIGEPTGKIQPGKTLAIAFITALVLSLLSYGIMSFM